MTTRSIVSAAVLLAGVLVAGTAPAAAQKQITLVATASSPAGEPVGTLEPSRVHVTENGVAAAIVKVEAVERVRKLHLLVDAGIGMPPEAIADLRTGLRGLIEGVPEGVQISLVTTAPQPRMIERGTTDKAKALKAVDLVSPDSGSGRFIESLYEAGERIERDKDSANVIVSIATTTGDTTVRDNDVKQVYQRSGNGRMRIFVVLFAGRNVTTGSGVTQQQVGEAVAGVSGGRFERINTTSRVISLLKEIGTDLSTSMGASSRQYRITADRPGGQSGALGQMSLSLDGLVVSSVALESR